MTLQEDAGFWKLLEDGLSSHGPRQLLLEWLALTDSFFSLDQQPDMTGTSKIQNAENYNGCAEQLQAPSNLRL